MNLFTEEYCIKGLVQGVGYRPFVALQAESVFLTGYVRNTNGIVTIVVSGNKENLSRFYDIISSKAPSFARIDSISRKSIEYIEFDKFSIIESNLTDEDVNFLPSIPVDLPTCKACEKELFDKSNNRYLHPFISCVSCGPRYSIINKIPYDRETIVMDKFKMCESCFDEYHDIENKKRRRHAQTIACPKCGPVLKAKSYGFEFDKADIIKSAIDTIKAGGIVAIKDIGGFHLCVDPYNDIAVKNLRLIKGREEKPFAVMFDNIDTIEENATINELEKSTLCSNPRPIVLVKKKNDAFSQDVCGISPYIGAFLPCNPIQLLLLRKLKALVMTSANRTNELMIIENKKMLSFMENVYKSKLLNENNRLLVLYHDRDILASLDDSVIQIVDNRIQFIRRSRGYIPEIISCNAKDGVIALGGDLKNTFSLSGKNGVITSQYFGDLEDIDSQNMMLKELERLQNMLSFEKKHILADLHPYYYSKKIAKEMSEKENLEIDFVQHHKAHAASVMAENNINDNIFLASFDGTGYGEDGTILGSEFFLVKNKQFIEAGHLKAFEIIGSNGGAKNCLSTLYGTLNKINIEEYIDYIKVYNPDFSYDDYLIVKKAIKNHINTYRTTSMGRLFDAVSSLLGICNYNSYEGKAPVLLEYLAMNSKKGSDIVLTDDISTLFEQILLLMKNNEKKEDIAKGFILAVSKYIFTKYKETVKAYNMRNIPIGLSGGTFLNKILMTSTIELFKENNIKVYTNQKLPPNDGCISLGQIYYHYLMSEE